MEIASGLITSLGFPIAVAVLLALYVRDLLKQNREDTREIRLDNKAREKELIEVNKMFAVVLSESSALLSLGKEQHEAMIDKMGDLDERVRNIEHKVEMVDAKVTRPIDRLDK